MVLVTKFSLLIYYILIIQKRITKVYRTNNSVLNDEKLITHMSDLGRTVQLLLQAVNIVYTMLVR